MYGSTFGLAIEPNCFQCSPSLVGAVMARPKSGLDPSATAWIMALFSGTTTQSPPVELPELLVQACGTLGVRVPTGVP